MRAIESPEFEAFQSALRGVSVRYVLRVPQQRNWRLTCVDLGAIGLMAGREGAATVCTGVAAAGCFNTFISLCGRAPLVLDGRDFEAGKIAWMAPDCGFHRASCRPASWLRVTMSCDSVLSWLACREDEADPGLQTRNRVVTSKRASAELIRLARGAMLFDAACGNGLRGSGRELAVGRELLDAALRAVVPIEYASTQGRRVSHAARILDRALDFIASRREVQIHIDDLCRVTGVSERTLRNVFYREFGMSPHQYLMVARLHDVRAAIRRAGPSAKVSGLCADFGIWDFGRFAGQYRKLFGHLPSQDLAARLGTARQLRFGRGARCRSSVALGYSPNSTR